MARRAKVEKKAKSAPPRAGKVADVAYRVEERDPATLKAHPRNYKSHPPDQLEHIESSLRQFGPYRNVVAARDGTLLAGHGVIEAAKRVGLKSFPVRVMDLAPDDPMALKILALDNELPKFGENDDRALSEILREIRERDAKGLLGTGYDDKSLAAFLMVTRPESEIRTIDEANEWVGMPEYEPGSSQLKIVITFKNEADRKRFAEAAGLKIDKYEKYSWSTRWPFTEREDPHSLRFESAERIRAAEKS